jgi:AcrR family transcriptional regulator
LISSPEKRKAILDAALELIVEHGFHGAPVAAIAERSGVGTGTIYRYFENKDVLITELFHELHEQICAELIKEYDTAKSIMERFIHLSTAMLRYFIAHPLHFRFLEQYLNSPYGAAFRRAKLLGNGDVSTPYLRLFEDGRAKQVVKDLPMVVLFALAFGPLFAVARDHILGFIEMNDALIMQTVQACWDGVKRA